jgi:hypothetical protein
MYFGKSFHSIYHFGKATIIALDTRSERSKLRVISTDSYIALQKNLQWVPDNCEHVIVLLAVPVVFPEINAAVNAVEFVEKNFPSLYKKIPNDPMDDFVDQWRYKGHLEERRFLVNLMQDYSKTNYVRFSIFSGDVHCAAVGRIRHKKITSNRRRRF